MKYDLHVHSNVSDGKLSRKQVIQYAINNNLEHISFTEHNDFQPIEEDFYSNLNFINGVEFDTIANYTSFHTLCYFKNNEIDSIQKLIDYYRKNTNDRSDLLLQNITKKHNIDVDLRYLQNFFNKTYITKRDIIDWLIFKKHASSVTEAVCKFTGKNSISYIPKFSLDFRFVADTIKNLDGKLILAHPSSLKYNNYELENFIKELLGLGLDGIEVINSAKVDNHQTFLYTSLANKYNLLLSGGSDFHNFSDNLGIEGDEPKKLINSLKY